MTLGLLNFVTEDLLSAVLSRVTLIKHSCLRYGGSVVHFRNVFQVTQSTERSILIITAGVFRLFKYLHFVGLLTDYGARGGTVG